MTATTSNERRFLIKKNPEKKRTGPPRSCPEREILPTRPGHLAGRAVPGPFGRSDHGPRPDAAGLDLQLYAGLSITGAVGTVYSIEYVTDLAQTNNASAWRCLEFLQLPASPYLWADKSAPATGRRFYRAVVFAAQTNLVFIPPGTFRMGSPTNEVDRLENEGPQTAVTISRGFGWGSMR